VAPSTRVHWARERPYGLGKETGGRGPRLHRRRLGDLSASGAWAPFKRPTWQTLAKLSPALASSYTPSEAHAPQLALASSEAHALSLALRVASCETHALSLALTHSRVQAGESLGRERLSKCGSKLALNQALIVCFAGFAGMSLLFTAAFRSFSPLHFASSRRFYPHASRAPRRPHHDTRWDSGPPPHRRLRLAGSAASFRLYPHASFRTRGPIGILRRSGRGVLRPGAGPIPGVGVRASAFQVAAAAAGWAATAATAAKVAAATAAAAATTAAAVMTAVQAPAGPGLGPGAQVPWTRSTGRGLRGRVLFPVAATAAHAPAPATAGACPGRRPRRRRRKSDEAGQGCQALL
jgi:hypothetical protein